MREREKRWDTGRPTTVVRPTRRENDVLGADALAV